MENGTTTTKTRGRPAAKNVDERIATLTEKIAALRTQQSERKRKETAKLAQIIGTVILTAVNDNADPELSAVVTRHLRARVTRSGAERALVESWLASQQG